jgi:hypothetical protein
VKRLAGCICGVALALVGFAGCASEKTEVRESAHQPYASAEDETPQTPGERRPGPINDRAGADWSW